MRVLFTSGDLCDGGAQRVISIIANELSKFSDVEVYLYVFSRSNRDYQIDKKVHLTYMCESADSYAKLPHIKRLLRLRKYIKEIKPDVGVGFLQGGYALYFASLGMHFSRVASARVSPDRILKANGINAHITRFWFRHADAVILQTESQAVYTKHSGWKRCVVIGNPLSDETLLTTVNEYRDKCEHFVMVGRLAKQKNYYIVIEAIKEIIDSGKRVFLDIYGTGDSKNIEETIKQNNLEEFIQLKGWTNNTANEIMKYDAFILSSDYEGMPNSLMEAMAIGLPVISTNCPTGPSDLIDNEITGVLVPVNDRKKMKDAIIKLLDMSKDQRMILGSNAKNKISMKYNARTVAEKWKMLFYDILA